VSPFHKCGLSALIGKWSSARAQSLWTRRHSYQNNFRLSAQMQAPVVSRFNHRPDLTALYRETGRASIVKPERRETPDAVAREDPPIPTPFSPRVPQRYGGLGVRRKSESAVCRQSPAASSKPFSIAGRCPGPRTKRFSGTFAGLHNQVAFIRQGRFHGLRHLPLSRAEFILGMPFGEHSVLGKELTRAWGAGLDGHRDVLILTGYACEGRTGCCGGPTPRGETQ